MFKSIIVSIAESVIVSCGKSFSQKLSLKLKKHKIKKELYNKLQAAILKKHGDMTYYNSLDCFLANEDFAGKLISYCFYPGFSPFKSISSHLTYLSEKFIDKNPNYFIEKSNIYQDL